MGKNIGASLLFFVGGLSAVVQAQAGAATITDFTVLVEKKTSTFEHFNFNLIDETGETYFCSTPLDLPLNTVKNPGEDTVSES